MPLKNYTTEVPVNKTLGQIQGNLVAHGARAIMTDYNDAGEPIALAFMVPTANGELPFRLPANVQKVETIFLSMRARPPEPWMQNYETTMARIKKQAAMTAWRTIKDWVDAQLAFIETEMVTIEEVFLPYLQIKDGQTLYGLMLQRGFLLPEGRGDE